MKTPFASRIGWQALVTALLALAAVGWPSHGRASETRLPEGWAPLDAARLDAMRGGFALPSGLVVSFGFERMAWVDGELVASLRIDIPDIARITPVQARELEQLRQVQVVQVGPGNAFDAAGSAGAGLVLQNTLDGVHIRVSTSIDAASNTLGLLQAINFSDALGHAGLIATGTP
ncbi:hypothetical protein [Luteimonas terricola]|uniref:Uncharacterized protein n=1 Tax=Luteimonas terricola TaxID=645597 RepID=A0ABQ2EEU9_9GAMM|nr:hypothetical protein [Luteimonas terricola]GGK09566.1 hypothetical protein GCM10011394_18750 [Luteimonas terricola]